MEHVRTVSGLERLDGSLESSGRLDRRCAGGGVSLIRLPGGARAVASGEFDAANADLLAEVLGLGVGPHELDVDCSGVTFCGLAAARCLLGLHARQTAVGGRLVLRRPSRAMRHVLSTCRWDQVLEVR